MSYEWMETAQSKRRRQSESSARIGKADVEPAIQRAAGALFQQQAPEGFWCGELTADTTLESDYMLLQSWLECLCRCGLLRRKHAHRAFDGWTGSRLPGSRARRVQPAAGGPGRAGCTGFGKHRAKNSPATT